MKRLGPLDPDSLQSLPKPCQGCLFWELGRPRPDPRTLDGPVDEMAGDPVVQKLAWCSAQTLDGHPPGRVARLGDEVVGYILFAPPGVLAPRRAPVPAASDDALQVATLWVEPHERGGGIGRLLIQAAIKDALRLDLTAVEVYGDRRDRDFDCVVPAMWLSHEGFEVHREHPRYPLMRLDVRRTARWTETLEAAWDEVLDLLPRRSTAPHGVPARETETLRR